MYDSIIPHHHHHTTDNPTYDNIYDNNHVFLAGTDPVSPSKLGYTAYR